MLVAAMGTVVVAVALGPLVAGVREAGGGGAGAEVALGPEVGRPVAV
jgi:hypothetical protein